MCITEIRLTSRWIQLKLNKNTNIKKITHTKASHTKYTIVQ